MICWRRVGDLRQALLLLSARDLCSYSLPMLSARVLYFCYWLPCLSAPDLGFCFDTRLLISAPAHLSVPAPALCSGSLISDLCSCSLFLLSAPALCSCSLFSALTLCSRSLLSLSAFSALALDSRSQLSWSRSRCSLSGLCSLLSALCSYSLLSAPALCTCSLLLLSAPALCSLLSLSALALCFLCARSRLSLSALVVSLSLLALGSRLLLYAALCCSLLSALCPLLFTLWACSLLSLSALALFSRFLLSLSALALCSRSLAAWAASDGDLRVHDCARTPARDDARPSFPSLTSGLTLQVASGKASCFVLAFPHHCILLPDPCRARDAPMHVCLCALLA